MPLIQTLSASCCLHRWWEAKRPSSTATTFSYCYPTLGYVTASASQFGEMPLWYVSSPSAATISLFDYQTTGMPDGIAFGLAGEDLSPPLICTPPPRAHRAVVAHERAERLLLANLSAEQQAQYGMHNHFDVLVNGRRYRITRTWSGGVLRLRPNGDVVETLCIHFNTPLPMPDLMLAQKFLLESDEGALRRTANIRTLLPLDAIERELLAEYRRN